MQRHKIAAALAVVGLPALAALSGPAAAETVYHGPKCGDVVDGSAAYDGSTVVARMSLGATQCKNVAYTLYVLDETATTLLATATGTPTTDQSGGPATGFLVEGVTAPTNDRVCVYVTTTRGKRVLDRAPDDGCVPIDPNTAGGQRFH